MASVHRCRGCKRATGRPGDRVVYYSPTQSVGGQDRLQAFTALGVVAEGEPFAFDMGRSFVPFRRRVLWQSAHQQSIKPLLQQLQFTADKRNWGYQLRFGLLNISEPDMDLIASAMATRQQGKARAAA